MNNNPHLCSALQLTHSFLMQHLIYDQQKLRQGSKGGSPPQVTDEKLVSKWFNQTDCSYAANNLKGW